MNSETIGLTTNEAQERLAKYGPNAIQDNGMSLGHDGSVKAECKVKRTRSLPQRYYHCLPHMPEVVP
jgi:hypothetical protein